MTITATPTHTPKARPRSRQCERRAITACVLSAAMTAANADAVRISGVDYLGDLPTKVADHHGLFAAQGIDAVVEYGASGRDNLRALRAGETDFALMALTPLAIDLAADSNPREPDDPVILASIVHSTRLNQVVALAPDLDTPTKLSGSRIGLMRGTNAEFVWALFAAYHGIDPATVEIADRAINELPDALKDGEIDAAVLWEPWTSRLRFDVGDRLNTFAGSNIYTAKWVVVTRRDIANREPEQARAVLAAYDAAIDVIRRDPAVTAAIYAEEAGGIPHALREERSSVLYGLNLDWSLLASLRQQFEWAITAGYAGNEPQRDILARIDPRPLRIALPSAVGIPAWSGWNDAPVKRPQ